MCVYIYMNVIQLREKRKSCHFQQHGLKLESIMLSGISQRKAYMTWYHLYVGLKKSHKSRKSMCQELGVGETGRGW